MSAMWSSIFANRCYAVASSLNCILRTCLVLQVDQWSVVSSVDDHLVNLWAIIDAHKREEPDYKACNSFSNTRAAVGCHEIMTTCMSQQLCMAC